VICIFIIIRFIFIIEQHPFINDDLPNRILCGAVIIKPNVKEFTSDGYGVIFEDGTQVDHIDCVLMATGFDIKFPYLNKNILSVNDNKIQLYKFVWPSHLTHPTLAMMGLIQPWGAINPMTELQSRWVVRVFKGELKLPSQSQMNKDIEKRMLKMSERYVASPRHTIQVDYVEYCNELSDEVGCRPNTCEIVFNYYII
jgi:dimethylaniline monooxygenase (N-oxide forming)